MAVMADDLSVIGRHERPVYSITSHRPQDAA